jgi:DMSO/TMAO reductase YedYZ molybdopterin-dependent catalytic subunit
VLGKTPDFVKSVPVWKALDENIAPACEMNGQPLPHWNGYPVRVVVPGWTATYWMKHLTSIQAVSGPSLGSGWRRRTASRREISDRRRFISQETDANTPSPRWS